MPGINPKTYMLDYAGERMLKNLDMKSYLLDFVRKAESKKSLWWSGKSYQQFEKGGVDSVYSGKNNRPVLTIRSLWFSGQRTQPFQVPF